MQNFELQENLPQVDDGEKRAIVEGGASAMGFVRRVALGERVGGKKYAFNGDFIRAIHQKVCGRLDVGGRLREENVGVSGIDAVSWHDVPTRFYLFGCWLQVQMAEVASRPDDIIFALQTAAAAHYGLTQPDLLHPFTMGNGRTARALTNAILMRNTDELRMFKVAIPPMPILRSHNEEQDQKYLKALRSVTQTQTLNPLMVFLAKKWSENLANLTAMISAAPGVMKNKTDAELVGTLRRRKIRLDEFINGTGGNGGKKGNSKQRDYNRYYVPSYFDSVWLKGLKN